MEYSFKAIGHKHITGKHKKTFEFTKDDDLTLNGDCILGVNSDFDSIKLQEFIKNLKQDKISINLTFEDKNKAVLTETITATINKSFSDENEIVIRKSNMETERTLATLSDKSAIDLSRDFMNALSNPEQTIIIKISQLQ
tara:strand:+ start:243 stop:662 length:420 start_codon:yes stop_codon:yes gene_type:complete